MPLRKSSTKIFYRTILSSPEKFNKKGTLTSSITSIAVAGAAAPLSFFRYLYHFFNAGCTKLRIKKLCSHFFIYRFLPLFLSCLKLDFFISSLRSLKIHERCFFNRKLKLGLAIEISPYNKKHG